MSDLALLRDQLNQMANAQFESPEFKRLLSVKFTLPRARFYIIHNASYNKNHRDCWAYVQAAAPLDVKKLIWKHEEDELIIDKTPGRDHYSLVVKQAEAVSLTRQEIEQAEPVPGARGLSTHGSTSRRAFLGSKLLQAPRCWKDGTIRKSSKAAD
jgi:pyrroloquinoline quinone (PQQ) biosynthesis protein C